MTGRVDDAAIGLPGLPVGSASVAKLPKSKKSKGASIAGSDVGNNRDEGKTDVTKGTEYFAKYLQQHEKELSSKKIQTLHALMQVIGSLPPLHPPMTVSIMHSMRFASRLSAIFLCTPPHSLAFYMGSTVNSSSAYLVM